MGRKKNDFEVIVPEEKKEEARRKLNERWEELYKNHHVKDSSEDGSSRPHCGDVVKKDTDDSGIHTYIPVPDYYCFSIARYALTDVIEELTAARAKEIVVTKEDNNLVVKYKPYWRK